MPNQKQRKKQGQFIKQHPLARSLATRELLFAMDIASEHEHIKLYRSRGEIVISREAMYSPGVREGFTIRARKSP